MNTEENIFVSTLNIIRELHERLAILGIPISKQEEILQGTVTFSYIDEEECALVLELIQEYGFNADRVKGQENCLFFLLEYDAEVFPGLSVIPETRSFKRSERRKDPKFVPLSLRWVLEKVLGIPKSFIKAGTGQNNGLSTVWEVKLSETKLISNYVYEKLHEYGIPCMSQGLKNHKQLGLILALSLEAQIMFSKSDKNIKPSDLLQKLKNATSSEASAFAKHPVTLEDYKNDKFDESAIFYVKKSDLSVVTFVREKAEDQLASDFSELMRAGKKFKPILVTELDGILELVDGRTRKYGYELAEIDSMPCVYIVVESRTDLIQKAYAANNVVGPRQETSRDTILTARRLLEEGLSFSAVVEFLKAQGFPPKVAHRYTRDAELDIQSHNMGKARMAIVELEITLEEAATRFNVPLKALRNAVAGKKIDRTTSQITQRGINGNINKALLEAQKSIKKIFAGALSKVDEGTLSISDADEAFVNLTKKLEEFQLLAKDLEDRYKSKYKN